MPCRRVYVSEKQLNGWDPIGRRNGIPPAKGAGLPSAGSQGLLNPCRLMVGLWAILPNILGIIIILLESP